MRTAHNSFSSTLVSQVFKFDFTSYDLKPIHKLLLLYFCYYSSNKLLSSASVPELMSFCGATKPTIISALKVLESHGFISVAKTTGSTNTYKLLIDLFPSESDQLLGYLSGAIDTPPPLEIKSPNLETCPSDIQDSLISLVKKF